MCIFTKYFTVLSAIRLNNTTTKYHCDPTVLDMSAKNFQEIFCKLILLTKQQQKWSSGAGTGDCLGSLINSIGNIWSSSQWLKPLQKFFKVAFVNNVYFICICNICNFLPHVRQCIIYGIQHFHGYFKYHQHVFILLKQKILYFYEDFKTFCELPLIGLKCSFILKQEWIFI